MSQPPETWTIKRLLEWTTQYFSRHGSSSPRLDAEVLLAHVLKCQRIELYTQYDVEPTESQRGAFRELVKQRAAGKPVAYLVGHREFYSLDFEVTPDVLVPRPETEHLVLEAVDRGKQLMGDQVGQRLQVVDVGTGSGCVAVAIAKYLPNAHVMAIDISAEALAVARRNVSRHNLDDRITLLQSDLLAELPAGFQADLIVSNPPYVSEEEYERLEVSVREYEPRLALVAGPHGGEIIQRLLGQATERLNERGLVLIEASPMLIDKAPALLGGNWEILKITADLAGLPRVMTLKPQRNA